MVQGTCFVEENFQLVVTSARMAEKLLDAVQQREDPVPGWYLTCQGQVLTGVRCYDFNPRPCSFTSAEEISEVVEKLCFYRLLGKPWEEVVLNFSTRQELA